MSAHEQLSAYKRDILRRLKLSPMHKIMRELSARGESLKEMRAFEPFAREGSWHTVDYADDVASLTAWEIDPAMEPALRKNLPRAQRSIIDSYEEILTTDQTFDFIVVDAPMLPHGSFCEHFHFFPLLFRVAQDPLVLVLSVALEGDEALRRSFPSFFGARHLAERRLFYACEDPAHITAKEAVHAYKSHAAAQGWTIEWCFTSPRDRAGSYFVMKLRRLPPGARRAVSEAEPVERQIETDAA
jgi:hypothetical protein